MAQILIVDDETRHCQSLREYLALDGHLAQVASSAEQAFEVMARTVPDAILLDIRLPGLDGLSAIQRLRQLAPAAPVVIMTAFGTLDTAASALRAGVFEYLVKPFSLDELNSVLTRALSIAARSDASSAAEPTVADGEVVIGRSPVMQRIFNRIVLAAASDIPVLLTGESGTGKEVLARAIHRYSARRDERFLPVFLAALSPSLIESELFGHARGSYTGADQHRSGLLEQVGAGTILLDELGDIPPPLQVKLLRVIEQREVTRVGEDVARPVQLRIVAATNKSLPDLIARGEFRQDLFYRLSVYHIELPPLRERREDIPDLARFFLQRFRGQQCPSISDTAMQELQSRPWPGNIRELRNAIEHAAIASRGASIAPEHFPPAQQLHRQPQIGDWKSSLKPWFESKLEARPGGSERSDLYRELLEEIEPAVIELALSHCQQNQTAAAKLLGIDRKTLRTKSG